MSPDRLEVKGEQRSSSRARPIAAGTVPESGAAADVPVQAVVQPTRAADGLDLTIPLIALLALIALIIAVRSARRMLQR